MRLRALTLLITFLTATSGMASPRSHVIAMQDAYSGLHEWHLRVGTHHCAGVVPTDEWGAHLDFGAFEERDHTISYAVAPELDMKHAFKPHGKAVLQTLADGVSVQFSQSADASIKRFRSHAGRSVSEVIPFTMLRQDVEHMSQVSLLRFRLDTRSGEVERCATASDLRDLADFLQSTSHN